MSVDAGTGSRGSLQEFFDKGGFWRLLLFVVPYLAAYLFAGKVVANVFGASEYADADLLSSAGAVFFQLTTGLIFGAIVLLTFTSLLGWNKELFARQPVSGSRWMWLGPLLVAIPVILRILDIDWGGPGLSVVLTVLGTGLLIGFVEELLYRGIAVKMLRDGGHGEWVVAAVSSVVFGLSHGINIFQGQKASTVGSTVVYTICFGILMYLSLRVIGFLAAAMILHGITDPTTILATGGVDAVQSGTPEGLSALTGLATIIMMGAAVILLLFVGGRTHQDAPRELADTV